MSDKNMAENAIEDEQRKEITRLQSALAAAESRVRSLEADLKAERERAEEAERAKHGTPCKCESWIDACRQAEELAERLAGALREIGQYNCECDGVASSACPACVARDALQAAPAEKPESEREQVARYVKDPTKFPAEKPEVK